jgi:hypothetical protein
MAVRRRTLVRLKPVVGMYEYVPGQRRKARAGGSLRRPKRQRMNQPAVAAANAAAPAGAGTAPAADGMQQQDMQMDDETNPFEVDHWGDHGWSDNAPPSDGESDYTDYEQQEAVIYGTLDAGCCEDFTDVM